MSDDTVLRVSSKVFGEVIRFARHCVEDKDNFRKRLLKLSAQGRREDLHTALSHSMMEEDMEGMLMQFDRSFIELFPDFINNYQRLFPAVCGTTAHGRIGVLSMEQRVAALIRLGFIDPRQIADMLNLSIGTVYNYRSRLRSRLPHGVDIPSVIAAL